MALSSEFLPFGTDFDPAEDPPGSVDPLGTLAYAELLADVLFPGFTARMFRPRLLTMAVVATAIADRVVENLNGREDLRLEARLAFERLAVFALARAGQNDPENYGRQATRRLPGVLLAKRALSLHEPLTRQNFLRGQAVNGPTGVVMRLAEHTELLDDRGRLARFGQDLFLAWAVDEHLPGVLNSTQNGTQEGDVWMRQAASATERCIISKRWPRIADRLWDDLASHLRVDRLRGQERRSLIGRLDADETRARMLRLLEEDSTVAEYNQARPNGRNVSERATLVGSVRPALAEGPVDTLIAATLDTLEAYERASNLLQQAFDGISWGLKRAGGRSSPDHLRADSRLCRHFERTRSALQKTLPVLDAAIHHARSVARLSSAEILEPLSQIRDEAERATASAAEMLGVVMCRHERVQKAKRKAMWIDRDTSWTLMPGFGIDGELPTYAGLYLHPVRVQNAYSFLSDLRRVRIGGANGEAD